MPDVALIALLFAAGMAAGICNAIAGGGTFFTFPVFLGAGLPPVIANASNSIAVWPGHALAVPGYRAELRKVAGRIKGMVVIAALGGAVGALLLALVGNALFARLIPFLILFATLLFAFGQDINTWLDKRNAASTLEQPTWFSRCCEFLIAVYGGFFGAGMGIMLMAGLHMLGVHDVQVNNALKNLLGAVINSIAVVIFAFSGLVSWPHTAIAFVGAVIGGLLGGRLARWLPAHWLRRVVIGFGVLLSLFYFNEYFEPLKILARLVTES